MKDWDYHFSSISYPDWIRQIEADLKGAPISSLSSDWWPGEALDPLIHPTSSEYEPVWLPDQLFLSPPRIKETIDTALLHQEEVQRRILDALQYGAEDIVLRLSGDAFDPEWIQGVHLDMVRLQVEPGAITPESLTHLLRAIPEGVSIRLPVSSCNTIMDDRDSFIRGLMLDQIHRFIITCPLALGPDWLVNTAEALKSLTYLVNAFQKNKEQSDLLLRQVLFSAEATGGFMLQIIRHRVWQLLWLNLVKDLYPPSEGSTAGLEITISQHQGESPDHFLIRASMSGLAAALSGVSSLGFQPLPDVSGLYRRVSRNIHHLLHLESHMYKGLDPMAGSYLPDYYTRKWATEIRAMLLTEK